MVNTIQEEVIPARAEHVNANVRLYITSHSYYGSVNNRVTNPSVADENQASEMKEETFYINNSSRNVTVMDRSGLAYTVTGRPNPSDSRFFIRRVYSIRGDALASAIKSVTSLSSVEGNDLEEIKKALINIRPSKHSDIKIVLDYPIPLEDISKGICNTLYHYQTDMMVSLESVIDIPKHPYSTTFQNVGLFGIYNNYDYKHTNDFLMKIRYVNHSRHASSKYINILGEVKALLPEKDAPFRVIQIRGMNKKETTVSATDYIEIFTTAKNDLNNSTSTNGVTVQRYTLEDAHDIFGLYDNPIDAKNHGNVEAVRKKELATIEHANSLLKQQLQADKSNFEREADIRKQDLNIQALRLQEDKQNFDLLKVKFDKEKLALENEQEDIKTIRKSLEHKLDMINMSNEWHSKDMNMRMQTRKDTVDIIKFVPGLVVAVAGLIGLYVKLINKSD